MPRVLVLAGPVLAFLLTRVMCHALAGRRRDEELRGRETGRIVTSPRGGYTEIREPAHWAVPPSADPATARTTHPEETSSMNRLSLMAGALKRIGAARWKAQPPEPRADDAATTEYLYVPCVRTGYNGHSIEIHSWVQEVPLVKKTARLIYYTSDSWKRRDAVVSPGCVNREQFEADTRCRGEDRCRHGYPAGVIPIPGDCDRGGPAGQLFFATREAAESHLYRVERQRAGQAIREAALITELRRAMADAHPDHGGTAEQFIQARRSTRRRCGKPDDNGALAMTRRQHSELVAAHADLILADRPSIEAFAAYFEAQMLRGKARRLLCGSYRWLAGALWRY